MNTVYIFIVFLRIENLQHEVDKLLKNTSQQIQLSPEDSQDIENCLQEGLFGPKKAVRTDQKDLCLLTSLPFVAVFIFLL